MKSTTLEESGFSLADVMHVTTGALGGPEGHVTGVIVSKQNAETTVVHMYSACRLWAEDYPITTADIKEIKPAYPQKEGGNI